MSDSIVYAMIGLAALLMLGRPAIMVFFPGSDVACWLERTFPERFDSDGEDGESGGDGGGD